MSFHSEDSLKIAEYQPSTFPASFEEMRTFALSAVKITYAAQAIYVLWNIM